MENVKTKGSGSELLLFVVPSERGDSDLEGNELLNTCLDLLVTFFKCVKFAGPFVRA
jgi:hypothetical protein